MPPIFSSPPSAVDRGMNACRQRRPVSCSKTYGTGFHPGGTGAATARAEACGVDGFGAEVLAGAVTSSMEAGGAGGPATHAPFPSTAAAAAAAAAVAAAVAVALLSTATVTRTVSSTRPFSFTKQTTSPEATVFGELAYQSVM